MRGRIARGVAAATAVLAVTGLAGCRTSPTVAAYVGEDRVTVPELEAAVEKRLADPAIAATAEGQEEQFTRRVLTLLVQEEVYTAAAERYDVEVTDDTVRRRIEALLQGRDPGTVYEQLAAQGLSRDDVFENVRQQLVRQEIATAEGLASGLEETDLRARYEQVRGDLAQVQLGYITVPDQPTADAVLAELTADPASYAAVAARYPGQTTLAELQATPPDQVPGPLAEQVAATPPGQGFTLPLPQIGGVVVGFVAGTLEPTFEEVRPQLEQEAVAAVDEQVAAVVGEVRDALDVTVNPRFGVLDEDEIVEADGGVVDILGADTGPGTGAGTGPARPQG
jgi:peptidyl-prolyl cis-trans isomerase SurA